MRSFPAARLSSHARWSPFRATRPIALSACLACLVAAAPSPQPASLVLLDVAVGGPDGKRVAGLTGEDFEIVVGGATLPIASFAAGRAQPLALVLLLDASVSLENMVKPKDLRIAVEKWFVDRLEPQDRVQVGSFARKISIGSPLAGNRRALVEAVRKALDPPDAEAYGPSPIWDAVDAAVAAVAQASGRRAVVLVTDGRASGNRQGPAESGARAIAAGVTVSVVGEDWEMMLQQDAKSGVRVRPGVALEWMANATGGIYVQDTATPTAPGPILARLLDDLHERYTLGFSPPIRDGKIHPVEVRSLRPGLTIRTRRTYVAPNATP